MTRRSPALLLAACGALIAGLSAQGGAGAQEAAPFAPGPRVTRVNLHPDNERSRLYAVNYQQYGLIPICSEVEIREIGPETMRFRVVKTGRIYEYRNHKAAGEPFEDHLRRFFGDSCPEAELAELPEIDRRGVREGRALPGMSKRGVILAMGPPPRHVNPDLDVDRWMYWKSRFDRVEIVFDGDGRVREIRD